MLLLNHEVDVVIWFFKTVEEAQSLCTSASCVVRIAGSSSNPLSMHQLQLIPLFVVHCLLECFVAVM